MVAMAGITDTQVIPAYSSDGARMHPIKYMYTHCSKKETDASGLDDIT